MTAALVGRRLLALALVMLVTSFVVFSAMYLAPGSPESFLARGNSITADTLAAIRAQYHLDDPFLQRYLSWLGGLLTGDFGQSLQFRQPVGGLIASRLTTTLLLIGYASLLILISGVVIGVIAAIRRGVVDAAAVIGTTVAMGTPSFVVAIGLTSLFAVTLGWFPAFGAGEGLLDRLWHLTLPAVALALSSAALIARATRSSMLAELGKEYVETARVRGFSERRLIWRHAFRNAMAPVVTLTGLVVSGLLVTTTLVETAFGLNGMGSLLVQAVNAKDFPVTQAIVLIIVAAFAVSNLVVDLLYPLIDPRERGRAAG
ncbi:ABC transporter permease [Microtetraspora niveoalba]|uniref:ABC transporter permease n=1 Tax=Microtetraspora niveoalba TaxID=46175 RepID=UPI00082C02E9|nr:ABC transporter permease [Microtetraspora niveoalba]